MGNDKPSTTPATSLTPETSGATKEAKKPDNVANEKEPTKTELTFLGWVGKGVPLSVTLEMQLILLVLAAGALGGCLHATISFVDYLGNQTFVRSWIQWYLLRPVVGMSLALIFYFVIRAGFITATAQATDQAKSVNPFGIATLAALAGMFSKQTTDKLNEVFTTFFRTAPGEGDDNRKDKLHKAAPTISTVTPSSLKKGSGKIALTLKGENFSEKSAAQLNRSPRTTKFNNADSSLSVELLETDTTNVGTLELTVVNPASSGGTSSVTKITVEA